MDAATTNSRRSFFIYCSAEFPSHSDRHGGEEKERQPVTASCGYKDCRNEYRADSDLQAVVHTKLIPFLSFAYGVGPVGIRGLYNDFL